MIEFWDDIENGKAIFACTGRSEAGSIGLTAGIDLTGGNKKP